MKKYEHYFGVDVSKKTVDITLIKASTQEHRKFENNESGMQNLMQWFTELNLNKSATLFCMEPTGLYCFPLTNFLAENNIDIWIEHAAKIKKSTALERGKNDKVDSRRIAMYALKNLDRLSLWKPADSTIEKIKNLASLRERIVETKKKLMAPIKELEDMGNVEMSKLLSKSIKNSLAAIDKDLLTIEAKIKEIVNEDENLKNLYRLITSVVGIGFVTAVNLIIYTKGFTTLNDTRKLACYCGVAPFEYKSGTSIKGKTKVHFMANKKLKCNLHMASLTAIKSDVEIKAYYERKVAEGKNKMSVLNAVRNKLLARIVAVVNNKQEYKKRAA